MARTWEVARDGSKDFVVLQDAADACSAGDTILVHPGRYVEYAPYDFGALTENTYVVITQPDVTLMGVHPDSVIIGPETYTWTGALEPNGIASAVGAGPLTIQDLTVENIVQGVTMLEPAHLRNMRIRGCFAGVTASSHSIQDTFLCEDLLIENAKRYGICAWNLSTAAVFRRCTLRGADTTLLVSGTAPAVVEDSILDMGAYLQFQTGTRGVIRRTRVINGGTIIIIGRSEAIVNHCFVAGSGVSLTVSDQSRITGSFNRLLGTWDATVSVYGNSDLTLEYSDILNAGAQSVNVGENIEAGHIVDVRNNYWGTSDAAQIETWIVDANDDPARGSVALFQPFLQQSVSIVPQSIGQLKKRF